MKSPWNHHYLGLPEGNHFKNISPGPELGPLQRSVVLRGPRRLRTRPGLAGAGRTAAGGASGGTGEGPGAGESSGASSGLHRENAENSKKNGKFAGNDGKLNFIAI